MNRILCLPTNIGTIVVAGAVAQISPNRINAKDKKYFILSHPHCGMREFYANTNTQRDQWIETLNSLSNSLKKTAYYGAFLFFNIP